jgi:DNA-binding SARP family transcriptional activator
MSGSLRYQVLGPLGVFHGGSPCAPSAPKQRTVLALLLLHANRTLSPSTLIEELWGEHPPRSALAALQVYVTAIRRTLLPHDDGPPRRAREHPVLRTSASGYVLLVDPEQLDLSRFRSLAARGRTALARGECASAGEIFDSALALWRGAPLADVDHSGTLARHAARLEEERLGLLQSRIDADLCQKRGLDIVGEVEELCGRYPLREAFYQQFMRALSTAGRRADALGVYVRAYRTIRDEAGIEPGPGLRRIQEAILAGRDPVECQHCHRRQQ